MAAAAVLFDLDGTLWDSHPWFATIAAEGGDGAGHHQALAEGTPAATVIRSSVGERRFPASCAATPPPLHEGGLEALVALRSEGIPLGVVTNLPGWLALPMIAAAGLEGFFGVVVVYGMTRRRKPHPDPLLLALERLEVRPSPAVWYVGDTDGDAAAARAAGLSFAWVRWGYGAVVPEGARELDALRELTDL